MLAHTYADRVLNYVLGACSLTMDIHVNIYVRIYIVESRECERWRDGEGLYGTRFAVGGQVRDSMQRVSSTKQRQTVNLTL